jgi:hypothetical protein
MLPQVPAAQEDEGRGSGGRHNGRRRELMQTSDISARREAAADHNPETCREGACKDDVTGSFVGVVTNGTEGFRRRQNMLLEQLASRRDSRPGQQPGKELHARRSKVCSGKVVVGDVQPSIRAQLVESRCVQLTGGLGAARQRLGVLPIR